MNSSGNRGRSLFSECLVRVYYLWVVCMGSNTMRAFYFMMASRVQRLPVLRQPPRKTTEGRWRPVDEY